tara:strand:+ start:1020 stop:1310 length:291 start_codon:yes stop_codon:yes gene_type:complete
MQIFAESTDQEIQMLSELGFSDGTIGDRQFKYLGSIGYTDTTLDGRLTSYFTAVFGYSSWREYIVANSFIDKSWLFTTGLWDDVDFWRDSGDWNTA